MKIWSVNYVLHFGSVNIHKHCLYWSEFSTDINGKNIFNCLLLFKPFLLFGKLWVESVNSTIFSDMLGNWSKVYIWGILLLSLMESSIPTFQYFFLAIFHLVCKLLKSLFKSFFLVSKFYELSLWFQRCPEA